MRILKSIIEDRVLALSLHSYHLLLPISFKQPCAVGSKLFRANSIFPLGSGTLNTWAMSPANANNGQSFFFPDGTLKVFSPLQLRLSGKHRTAPSLIQSEKISGEMFRRVLRDFQLRMCGFSLCAWIGDAAVERWRKRKGGRGGRSGFFRKNICEVVTP